MATMLDRESLWSALQGNLHESHRVDKIIVKNVWGQKLYHNPLSSLRVAGVGTMKTPVPFHVSC